MENQLFEKFHNNYNKYKDYLPLLLLLTSIAGGLGQFINLIYISPDLLSFFSTSQMLTRGAFFISFLVINILILLFSSIVFSINNKWISSIVALILIKFFIWLSFKLDTPVFIVTICCLILFVVSRFINFEDKNVENESNKSKKYLFEKPELVIIILFFVIYLLVYEIRLSYYTYKRLPSNIPENVCVNNDIKDCYYLIYFNDKYVFYENDHDKLIIKNLDEILSMVKVDNEKEVIKKDSVKRKLEMDEYKEKSDSIFQNKLDSIRNQFKKLTENSYGE